MFYFYFFSIFFDYFFKLIEKYYNKSDEGPTVSFIIDGYINQMKKMVSSIKASHVMDVETKDANL